MSTLSLLHNRLHALGAQRRRARWLRGVALFAIVALGVLVALFLVDWWLFLNRAERVVSVALAGVAIVLGFKHWTFPWLTRREDELELALLIEQRQQIDSDLVGALQLESPRGRYGSSTALSEAVVEQGAALGQAIDWRQATLGQLYQRPLYTAMAIGAMVACAALWFPGHLQVFGNRLLLGSRHYPAQTFIAEVLVGKVRVPLGTEHAAPIRAPFGQPLAFQVRGQGELPEYGTVRLSTVGGESTTQVELRPAVDHPERYEGRLDRLVEDLRFQVFLGDDWSDEFTLTAIPLPIVSLEVTAEPPSYAQSAAPEVASEGSSRQIAVVEGSRVMISLASRNKNLQSATITIGDEPFNLQATDNTARNWTLPRGTPLDRVTDGVRYALDVVDVDGLSLAEAIEGYVRIKTDRPPRVTIAVVTQYVLPTGKPKVAFGATDDFGVSKIRLACLVAREDGSSAEESFDIPCEPVGSTIVQGRYAFDLAPLKLAKGDQVRISLEATDVRGDNPGKTALSEAVVLQVTDERGVLAAMTETDQRTARQMDLIIQRQLGLGDGP